MSFDQQLPSNRASSKSSKQSHRALFVSALLIVLLAIHSTTLFHHVHMNREDSVVTYNSPPKRYDLYCSDVLRQDTSSSNHTSPSFQWTHTSTNPSFRMSVHPPSEDIYVSGSIANSGCWECNLIRTVQETMEQYPDAYFIDFGANIGMYSLTVAAMGRMVFAFEPMHRNYMHICRSMQENLFSENRRLKVFPIAVSDHVHKVTFQAVPRNIGGTHMNPLVENQATSNGGTLPPMIEGQDFARAIPLDSIRYVFPQNQPVVIKMDIEGSEMEALAGAMEFLKDADIKLLVMEIWKSACFQSPNTTDAIFSLFQEKDLHPFEIQGGEKIPLDYAWREWSRFQNPGPEVFMDTLWVVGDRFTKTS